MSTKISFKDIQNQIKLSNKKQPHMKAVQKFNEYMIGELNKISSIKNKKILDLGASKYGHALVKSLQMGAIEYVGIDLDIDVETEVEYKKSIGKMLKMNAEKLGFDNEHFDLIITISTFEHFLHPDIVLDEMYRVLAKNGKALINFAPIWSSAGGYHLHQYPEIAKLIPKWGHLFLSPKQMKTILINKKYPNNLPLSIDQVIKWIYSYNDINRLDIQKLTKYFSDSKFKTEWNIPLYEEDTNDNKCTSKYLSTILPYSSNELMTRGFTILLQKFTE